MSRCNPVSHPAMWCWWMQITWWSQMWVVRLQGKKTLTCECGTKDYIMSVTQLHKFPKFAISFRNTTAPWCSSGCFSFACTVREISACKLMSTEKSQPNLTDYQTWEKEFGLSNWMSNIPKNIAQVGLVIVLVWTKPAASYLYCDCVLGSRVWRREWGQ